KSNSELDNADTNKIIDLSFLKDQTKNNSTFILEMMNIYKEQSPQEISTLEKAIAESNFSDIYKTAHTLRNMIGFFGLTTFIGNELLQIEKMAKAAKDINKIKKYFTKVKVVCQRALNELETLNITELMEK